MFPKTYVFKTRFVLHLHWNFWPAMAAKLNLVLRLLC